MTCCTPSSGAGAAARTDERRGTDLATVIPLPGGTFEMGDDSSWSYPEDGEGPVRQVAVAPFALDAHAVSNTRFAAFTEHTGYVTDAERFGWSFVFAGLLPDDFPETRGVAAAPWWRQVEGASWRAPEGRGSSPRADHPVVHVSHHDASAFAAWAGKRLPTEAEWEYAARAGSTTTFPWGPELQTGGRHHANVWQGTFPSDNTCDDGFYGTCPVDSFESNAFALFNMIGNVWEWTADARGDERLMKGGSYLCHASYCRRYRPAARSSAAPDSSMGNTGFRCASDAAEEPQ